MLRFWELRLISRSDKIPYALLMLKTMRTQFTCPGEYSNDSIHGSTRVRPLGVLQRRVWRPTFPTNE